MSRSSATLTDLIARIPTGATIIAVTDDGTDPRHAPARELAAHAAVRVGGTVLFCVAPAHDASPARSRPGSTSRPWTGRGSVARTPARDHATSS